MQIGLRRLDHSRLIYTWRVGLSAGIRRTMCKGRMMQDRGFRTGIEGEVAEAAIRTDSLFLPETLRPALLLGGLLLLIGP